MGAMTGAIGGGLRGLAGLGSDWVAKAQAAMPDQDELVRRLAQVTVNKAQAMQEGLGLLNRLRNNA